MTRGRPGIPPRKIRETADALLQRGMRPTVQLIRQMIGGSPNTISPVLREWRETLTPEQQLQLPLQGSSEKRAEAPSMITDLLVELWHRAIVFATIECKGSPRALQLATLEQESEQLRSSNRHLLERLEQETNEIANLRLQVADLQAIAKAALQRAENSETRYLGNISMAAARKQKAILVSRNRAAVKKVQQIVKTPRARAQATRRRSHRQKGVGVRARKLK